MEASFFPYLTAFAWIGFLFMIGVFLRAKIKILQTFLVPASLIAGIIGFVLMSFGLIVVPTSDGFAPIPYKVFSMMTYHLFAFGFVGIGLLQTGSNIQSKTVIRGGAWMTGVIAVVWGAQSLIGKSVFELYQSIVGGDFFPSVGYLVGAGYSQGPGQTNAHAMVWENAYGISNVVSTGMAFAALGFLFAVTMGVPLAKYGIRKGLLQKEYSGKLSNNFLRGLMDEGTSKSCARSTTHPSSIDNFAFHLGFMAALYGLAYVVGLTWANNAPKQVSSLGFGLMYSWGMCLAMFSRYIMRKANIIHILDPDTTRRLTSSTVDFMVCAAFLSINVQELSGIVTPLLLTGFFAAVATLLIIIFFAKRAPDFGFERAVACFGCYTGTAATGMLLLRIVDPEFESPCAIELAVMNAFVLLTLQPFLIGFPLIPEGFPMLWVCLAYMFAAPIVMYFLKLIRKPSW